MPLNHGHQIVFLADEGAEYSAEPEDEEFVEDYNRLLSDVRCEYRVYYCADVLSVQAMSVRQLQSTNVNTLDVAIPMHLKGSQPKTVESNGSVERVVFTLLSRKGV